jgi:hypothetical protein
MPVAYRHLNTPKYRNISLLQYPYKDKREADCFELSNAVMCGRVPINTLYIPGVYINEKYRQAIAYTRGLIKLTGRPVFAHGCQSYIYNKGGNLLGEFDLLIHTSILGLY